MLKGGTMDRKFIESGTYAGSELKLFAKAHTWKRYWGDIVRPYLGDEVLEVGAGIGESARLLAGGCRSWLCVEPDSAMTAFIAWRIKVGELAAWCQVQTGTIDAVGDRCFTSVIYIDVLEHIVDDAGELRKAAAHLHSGGRVIVLAPAHQWLFTPFDASVGHVRRYTLRTLHAVTPPDLAVERALYVDSVGVLASLTNLLLLKASMPTARQIAFWDKVMVPVSRVLDPIVRHRIGKTAIMIWRKR